MYRIRWLLLFAFALMFLAGCGANMEQTITFYVNEEWAAESSIEVPLQSLALVGGKPQMDTVIEEMVTEMEAEGARVSWNSSEEDGSVIYTLEAKGEGYEGLRQVAFEDAEITTMEEDGRRLIHFSTFIPRDFLDANRNTITLVGREIVSASNGDVIVDKGTVQWVNPSGRIEAVLEAKRGFGLLSLLIPIGLVAGVVGAFFLARQGFGRSRSPFCPSCGAELAPQAKFCPHCGQPR